AATWWPTTRRARLDGATAARTRSARPTASRSTSRAWRTAPLPCATGTRWSRFVSLSMSWAPGSLDTWSRAPSGHSRGKPEGESHGAGRDGVEEADRREEVGLPVRGRVRRDARPARRQGRRLRGDDVRGAAGAAGLHDHHGSL